MTSSECRRCASSASGRQWDARTMCRWRAYCIILLASIAGFSASAGADGPPADVASPARSKPYLNMPQTRAGKLPQTLSQVGAFENVKELTPREGLIAYDINAPFWSDGAQKQRWMALPPGQHLEFSPAGEWIFPAGTVFVKHFALPIDEAHPNGSRT